ncbi:cyclin G associated kinase [Trichuris trichiura]|uniref:Cyclin G associated kinase n=1 Tax=Trichuris trichiura TaxID=36087 RepID=A0A077YZU9_TRITR|nr:cyclin G associated kinase [Trichuris trichiura]
MENLLLDSKERVKLCDFGSATEKSYKPDNTWTAQRRSMLEEELNKCTTPMYRAPEMLDSYQNQPIDQRIDVWALGCILYYLCYMVHPFEDSAKLRILNANYTLPEKDDRCGVLHPLIARILQVVPDDRPSVKEILCMLKELAMSYGADLEAKVQLGPVEDSQIGNSHAQTEAEASFGGVGVFLESLKGQAGSIFKSLRETSSKIVQPNSMAPNKSSLIYLTSRLILLSSPTDMSSLDEAAKLLTARHGNRFAAYNLSPWRNADLPLGERVMHCGFPVGTAPSLKLTFSICNSVYHWLRRDVSNVAVFFSDNGGNGACIACNFLVFCKSLSDSVHCRKFIKGKVSSVPLTPSQARYVDYVASVLRHPTFYPLPNRVLASRISVSPVPIFNRMRNGCRPFVEIFSGDQKLLSTCQEYDKIPFVDVAEASFTIPFHLKFDSDATFVVSHARSTLGTKMQRKVSTIKMFQFQVHAGFLDPSKNTLTLELNDLCCLAEDWKYPKPFVVRLAYSANEDEQIRGGSASLLPNFKPDSVVPQMPFSSPEESACFQQRYGAASNLSTLSETAEVEQPKQEEDPKVVTVADLLSSLDWQPPPAEKASVPSPRRTPVEPTGLPIIECCEQDEHQLKAAEEPTQSLESNSAESHELVNLDADELAAGGAASADCDMLWGNRAEPPSFNLCDVDLTNKAPSMEASAPPDADSSHRENLLFDLAPGGAPTHHVFSEANLSVPVHMHRNLSTPLLLDQLEPFVAVGEPANFAAKSSTVFSPVETAQPILVSNKAEAVGHSATDKPLRPPSAFSRLGTYRTRGDLWSSNATAKTKLDSTAFEDLLSSQGFSGSASSKQSLASMKQEAECQGLTDEEAKVRKWADGKRRNIRGLLGSLHTVIWPENDRWQEVSMSHLLAAKEVKKYYRKACLAVHPDKFVGTPHETLAKLIFTELNDAWNEFEADTTVTSF